MKLRPRSVPELHLPPPPPQLSTSIDGAAAKLSAASNEDDAARGFADLAQQDPPAGDALTDAICAGMEQLGDQDDDEATGDNWRDFLIGQLEALIPQPQAIEKVEGLLSTWDLAQVNANLARVYYQGCVARG